MIETTFELYFIQMKKIIILFYSNSKKNGNKHLVLLKSHFLGFGSCLDFEYIYHVTNLTDIKTSNCL